MGAAAGTGQGAIDTAATGAVNPLSALYTGASVTGIGSVTRFSRIGGAVLGIPVGTIGAVVANGDETTGLDLAVGGIAGGAGGITVRGPTTIGVALTPNLTGVIEESLLESANESISNDTGESNENINVSTRLEKYDVCFQG